MADIQKIKNVSSANYGPSRVASDIRYIVVGMTNLRGSGYRYAHLYQTGQQLPPPKFTYNYVIDSKGSVYQTIDDLKTPYTIKSNESDVQAENHDVISICLMPTWNGETTYDEYEQGKNFPENPDTNEYFILTKEKIISGRRYPVGLYIYDGVDWQLEEELSGSESVLRPYNSDEWTFEDVQILQFEHLIKWLERKYHIIDSRVLRVFDYYKTYNPAPFIEDDGYLWKEVKEQLAEIGDNVPEEFFVFEESDSPIGEEIEKANPNKSVDEIIEQYGPDAGVYEYRCINKEKCPYYQRLMTGSVCSLSDIGLDLEGKVKTCPYREKRVKDNSFKGNALVDLSASNKSYNKFQFEIGIHDILKTTIDGKDAVTQGNLWHINEVTSECKWTTYLEGSVGEFDFTFQNKKFQIPIQEGFNVGYWKNGVAGFNGNVESIHQVGSNKEILQVQCLDFMKPLMCGYSRNFVGKTASEIFDIVCNDLNLPHRILTPSTFKVTNKNYFGDTAYTAIENAIIDTINGTGEWYIIQSNFGELVFRNILDSENREFDTPIGKLAFASNIKQLRFSEDSIITDWEFDSNVSETYNIVIGYIAGDKNENGATTVAAHKEAKDESTIQMWGRLAKFEEAPKAMEAGQLQQWVDQRLRYYNSPRRHIQLHCLGVDGLIAGNIIYLEIENVAGVGNIKGCLVVDKCTHNISHNLHTMDLECEIVQDATVQEKIYTAFEIGEKKEENEN